MFTVKKGIAPNDKGILRHALTISFRGLYKNTILKNLLSKVMKINKLKIYLLIIKFDMYSVFLVNNVKL